MEEIIISYLRESIVIICFASAPALVAALLVGFSVSFFQAATQIQEQTLSYVPKIIAVFLVLMVTGSWLMQLIVRFTVKIMTNFNSIISCEPWS